MKHFLSILLAFIFVCPILAQIKSEDVFIVPYGKYRYCQSDTIKDIGFCNKNKPVIDANFINDDQSKCSELYELTLIYFHRISNSR